MVVSGGRGDDGGNNRGIGGECSVDGGVVWHS